MAQIEFEHVFKEYRSSLFSVKNICFKIEKGEFVFITGKTGAGKSTILKLITNDISADSGKIIVNDLDISTISNKEKSILRRSFGIVSQNSTLIDNKTIYENISFVLNILGYDKNEIDSNIINALSVVGMKKKADYMPTEISSGELFRVILARAISTNPGIIIADEPTANLDNDMAWDIMCILNDLNRLGKTVIISTHSRELVNIMCKRVIHLIDGKIFCDNKKSKYFGKVEFRKKNISYNSPN